MFYRQINQYATAISTCFLEPMQHGSMSDTLVYTVKLPKNTPRPPRSFTESGEMLSSRSDLREDKKENITVSYIYRKVAMWS